MGVHAKIVTTDDESKVTDPDVPVLFISADRSVGANYDLYAAEPGAVTYGRLWECVVPDLIIRLAADHADDVVASVFPADWRAAQRSLTQVVAQDGGCLFSRRGAARGAAVHVGCRDTILRLMRAWRDDWWGYMGIAVAPKAVLDAMRQSPTEMAMMVGWPPDPHALRRTTGVVRFSATDNTTSLLAGSLTRWELLRAALTIATDCGAVVAWHGRGGYQADLLPGDEFEFEPLTAANIEAIRY